MKVIFLDIDGVLVTRQSLIGGTKIKKGLVEDCTIMSSLVFDFKCVDILRNVIGMTGAKIVISSSWRMCPDRVKKAMTDVGIEFIGYTPRLPLGRRGEEIKSWLIDNRQVDGFVILDDDIADMCSMVNHVVRTSMKDGLAEEHIPKILEIINLEMN